MELSFYDEVEIAPQTQAGWQDLRAIEGHVGAVVGMSRDEQHGHVVAYAVAVDDDVVWLVKRADLRPTGGRRRREDYMSGESLRVSQDGRVLD